MSNISKIKISGTSYDIKDENACNVVELTQAEYDALPTTTKTSNTLFVITDATAGDLSNYYTKSETSGATEISTALASKADTATTYTKTEVDNAITAATASKQDTLVSGTNIKTINNESILGSGNITIQGGGGGKAISGGTNISITTGETADTINCTLPIYSGTGDASIKMGYNVGAIQCFATGQGAIAHGKQTTASGGFSHSEGDSTTASGTHSHAEGGRCYATREYSHAEGYVVYATNDYEHSQGVYNKSNTGSTDADKTLFSVGNGNYQGSHNAFEIRQNGDIYIADTNDTSTTNRHEKPMIKLQDALGGGGSSYTAGDGIDITNDVISVTGKVDTSAITTSITSSSTDAQVPSAKAVYDALQEGSGGGLSLVKITESAYSALTTKDENTLYIVVADPS